MTKGKEILNVAAQEIGTKESPPNSNRVKYNTWFYGKEVSGAAYPWCMAFVQWCYDRVGLPLPLKTASCGGLLRWYKRQQPECVVKTPVVGCIVIFDFPNSQSDTDHVGIYESGDETYVTTIDGNTGTSNDADGGAVMRRTRMAKYIKAYIVPHGLENETEEQPMPKEELRMNTMREISDNCPWATETIAKLIDRGIIKGNGVKDEQGRPADMDLSRDMLRVLVMNDRAGLYG